MAIKSFKNFTEIHVDKKLRDNSTIKIHIKYLFSLIGFGIGSIFSLAGIFFEEYKVDIPSQHSHLPHLSVPFLLGIIGAVCGFFYGKKHHDKTNVVHELFVSQQILNLILDHLPVLIAYLDSDLRYRYVNKTFEDWHGLSYDDVYGKHIKDIVNEKAFGLISLNIAKADDGEIINFESSREFKGEEHFINSVMIPHLEEGKKIKGFFTIVTDITKLKKRENKIKKQKDELAELNATKDKFFSIISHDLKSPFNALLNFSELLFNDYEVYDEETRKEFIALIYESSQNTFKLLENLLAWSRVQMGKIEFNTSSINLKALIDENMDLLNQMALGKCIRLQSKINQDIKINTDKDLINTVIRNLLSNAIKFTPEKGDVTVSANLVTGDQLNDFIEISVKDTGLGISPGNMDKLFKIEKTYSTPGTKGESGTGLGLILCKEFIEKCDGKIGVESELGKGSIFTITIPKR